MVGFKVQNIVNGDAKDAGVIAKSQLNAILWSLLLT